MAAAEGVKYSIQTSFNGYEHNVDRTNLIPVDRSGQGVGSLPVGTLVVGSQNVLTNEGERIAIRPGYIMDGAESTALTPIISSFDWNDRPGGERHLRSYTAELEYRYVDEDGVVTWRRLANGFSDNVSFNFADYWDTTEKISRLLMVNGTSNIYDWSGGLATFASATANTITKEGSTTWAEESFYTAGTRSVVIDGTSYAYTGGETTTTLTGVTPDPTAAGHAVGAVIHQGLRTTANSAMTGITATFENDLIGILANQVYIGSFVDRQMYVSKVNDFTNYSFTSPRLPGEGALLNLDAPPIGLIPQEEAMYITGGQNDWFQTFFQLSADNAAESLSIQKLKTATQQAAQSQAMIAKDQNSVIFVTNEPTLTSLGRIQLVQTPQNSNISEPIKLDFDDYDFTNASVAYFQYYYYVAIPAEGIVRVFNLRRGWWEAPQVLDVSRFAIINGELYGHSASTPQTYKLFEGTSDNGNPIDARIYLGYSNFGKRANLKNFNEVYVEGYISSNTELTLNVLYEYNGAKGTKTKIIDGSDGQIVFNTSDGSLGTQSLGIRNLAGRGDTLDEELPPKFRVIKTMEKLDFYEVQFQFTSNQIDGNWQLLGFGPNIMESTAQNVAIKQ